MRFVVTSGGTAGHIYPALALAHELIEAGHEVFFAGTPKGQEARLVAQENIPYKAFDVVGFNRKKPMQALVFLRRTMRATLLAQEWLLELKPDAVAGFGGYASVPVCRAAAHLEIPMLIHEQNSTAGRANRMLAKQASAVALTYEQAQSQMNIHKKARVEVTGNPVRRALLELSEGSHRAQARTDFRTEYGIPQDAFVLMVFGGSQGARSVNEAVIRHAQEILAEPHMHVLHITGPKQYEVVSTQLAKSLTPEQTTRWHCIDYCSHIGEAYVASDLVVSRAGASSLAEIAVLGIPALLVPYPYATDDHQTANARSLVAAGAAYSIPDNNLTKPVFLDLLLKLIRDEALRSSMTKAARSTGAAHATEKLVSLLYEIS